MCRHLLLAKVLQRPSLDCYSTGPWCFLLAKSNLECRSNSVLNNLQDVLHCHCMFNAALIVSESFTNASTDATICAQRSTHSCMNSLVGHSMIYSLSLSHLSHSTSPLQMAWLIDIYALTIASQKSNGHFSRRQALLCSYSLSICTSVMDSNSRKLTPVGPGGRLCFTWSPSCGFAEA